MQVIYGLTAMALVALVSLTVQRTSTGTQQRMIVNEVATQLGGVGVEVLERIGSLPFDSKTDTTKVFTFPLVTEANQLTDASAFGGCVDFALCEDIDDFHGLTIQREQDDFTYGLQIDVEYVDVLAPFGSTYGPQSFAKKVTLSVTNPHLYLGDRDNPLTVTLSRVFTYQRVTSV